ncbi:MAG: hypothetical protein IT249_00260 [Chitinophagaceae bacterium]|nr:hypothetical protein [Chitinophagaceae bacterium]
MLKRIFALTLIAAFISIGGMAQVTYKNALGARIAPASYYDFFSFSYKTFVTSAGAIEVDAGLGRKTYGDHNPFTFAASAAYQHHFAIPVEGLNWYVGGGLTMYNSFSDKNGGYRGLGFGFFPTGGIDYKFSGIPLNLSADYRPAIFFAKPDFQDSFFATNFGISVRYVLGSK